jgi:hypothetical protein
VDTEFCSEIRISPGVPRDRPSVNRTVVITETIHHLLDYKGTTTRSSVLLMAAVIL